MRIDEQQLSLIDAWLTLERLAASSLIEAGMYHMLPQRVSRNSIEQFSLEQCLRASACGDLQAVLDTAQRLPPFMKLSDEWRGYLLSVYHNYLVVASRILSAKFGKTEARD